MISRVSFQGLLQENLCLIDVIVRASPAHVHAFAELVNPVGRTFRVRESNPRIPVADCRESQVGDEVKIVMAHVVERIDQGPQRQPQWGHDSNTRFKFPAHELPTRRLRRKIDMAEGMRADLMWGPACEDSLNQIRGIPVGGFFKIGAGIVLIPVSFPTLVLWWPGHVGVGQSAGRPFAAFEEKMANGRPSDRDGRFFQDAYEVGNIPAATHGAKVSLLNTATAEGPGDLKVSRDGCCALCSASERSDLNAVKRSDRRLQSRGKVSLERKNGAQKNRIQGRLHRFLFPVSKSIMGRYELKCAGAADPLNRTLRGDTVPARQCWIIDFRRRETRSCMVKIYDESAGSVVNDVARVGPPCWIPMP